MTELKYVILFNSVCENACLPSMSACHRSQFGNDIQPSSLSYPLAYFLAM